MVDVETKSLKGPRLSPEGTQISADVGGY